MDEGLTGLQCALCALSFFRARHRGKPRFKKPNRRHKGQGVSVYKEYVRLSREFIREARAKGWRGSIYEQFSSAGEPGETISTDSPLCRDPAGGAV